MSQTLSIDVFKNKSQLDGQGAPLVSIWFKWAGYSTQTLRELKELWKWISEKNLKSVSDEEAKLSIIRYAESKGGGVDEEDIDYVQDQYEDEEFSSPQSNGYLTALSFDTQEVMHEAEGYAYIILETDTVYTDVCDVVKDYEDYAEWYEEEYGEEPPTEEEIPVLEIAHLEGEFPAQELDEAIKQLEKLGENGNYTFRYPDGRIVELLE